ncbi:DNA-directed RNA polymerase I subunit RPA1-like protein [Leptotrombidium deliense]|uniref:DNA-directed RNA polymerase subunit n=1 Tax=Leptotrombidium deliense TaxID=299467 RepID=A0A443SGL3_9ACAR|nr:DNA-directed RNA polymerase I subunit RPA1-like protein [Leptotrombidium deliense]
MSAKPENVAFQFSGMSFKIYGSDEIKRLSVLEITNPKTFDALGHPTQFGLCDTAFGPIGKNDLCSTCGGNFIDCTGHYGHISLPVPLLKISCFHCHRLLFSPISLEIVLCQWKAIELGLDYLVDEIKDISTMLLNEEFSDVTIMREYVAGKLKERIDEELAIVGNKAVKMQVRNVVEKQCTLLKDLITGKLIKASKNCFHCSNKKRGMDIVNNSSIVMKASKGARKSLQEPGSLQDGPLSDVTESNLTMDGNTFYTASDARNHLRELWKNERDALQTIFSVLKSVSSEEYPTDVFFFDSILVSPNKFRPLMFMGGKQFENPRTTLLQSIMIHKITVANLLKSVKDESLSKENKVAEVTKLHYAWQRLQLLCNRLYDSELDKLPEKRPPGVKQIIEKKEGLFRKHMMGKRVNYAARSVILPDPYIMVDEVGIPLVFAQKLTYPQPVTWWNREQMKQAILNGPSVYPGATTVIMGDGTCIRLKPNDINQRNAIANMIGTSKEHRVKTVNRHLITGDVLLLNRQPTLHKPSMMAHRARILTGEKTMRLHYANCKSYNADFDGDEMNAHFPQSEFGRSEAYNIATVNNQFLVPKDGTPLSGLIQDHIVAAALMSIRGVFFTKEDYQELVFGAISFLNKKISILKPTIIKPIELWSGKQVITTIILNLVPEGKPAPSLSISSKIRPNALMTHPRKVFAEGCSPLQEGEMCESEVIIRKGELVCGIVDKANIGSTPYGLAHCFYELYGGKYSTAFMTALARLANNFLQIKSGLTLGILDILVEEDADKKRKKIIAKSNEAGKKATAKALNIDSYNDTQLLTEKYREAHCSRDPQGLKLLDNFMKSQTDELNNQISKVCLDGLVKRFPYNNLQLMIKAGAKGGTVNALQISCLMGQIELEGRRVPLMMSGRTLPSFVPYDTSPRAGGFVTGRFLTGIRPQEYFFHCMAGREGLIDTAVKTSRSGYLQRCLIKHLEGLVVNYDLTVRDSDGSVIQFFYGEDGLDICKSQLLKKDGFPLLCSNYDTLKATDDEMKRLMRQTNEKGITKLNDRIRKWIESNGEDRLHKRHGSAFQEYFEIMLKECKAECEQKGIDFSMDHCKKIIATWFELSDRSRKKVNKYWLPCPGPMASSFRPDCNYGVISEAVESLIKKYMETNCDINGLVDGLISEKEFESLIHTRFMRSICEPGESVGLLAAQSIGEPSTQMTLNTFHFAGRGEMNVTLGIPRLREILMTASPNIATPSMDIPLIFDETEDMDEVADKMRLQLNSVKLSDVLEAVDVTETMQINERGCVRIYKIRFEFLPRSAYKSKAIVKPKQIISFMERKFFTKIIQVIKAKMDHLSKYGIFYESHSSKKKKTNEDDEDVDFETKTGQDTRNGDNEMSSDEEDVDDKDATAVKSQLRHDQDLDYDEPEEVEVVAESDEEIVDDDDVLSLKKEKSNDVEVELIDSKMDTKPQKKNVDVKARKEERISEVLQSHSSIVGYDYDSTRDHKWCELRLEYDLKGSKLDIGSIIEHEAKKAYIRKIGNIEKAFVVKDPDAAKIGKEFDKMIKTEGVSFLEMVKYSHILDIKRMRSNDIHAVANTFGIEAARQALQLEIKNVFAVYGIQIDPRHLSLVSDYMTFDGKIKGMNRISMSANSSPLQQMSFETTTSFLKTAVLLGKSKLSLSRTLKRILSGLKDTINSPSARIFAGRPARVGTSLFDVRAQKVESNVFVSNPLMTPQTTDIWNSSLRSEKYSSVYSSKHRLKRSSPFKISFSPNSKGDNSSPVSITKKVKLDSQQKVTVNKRIKFSD